MSKAPYTEDQAVAALRRIAKRWPGRLTLFSSMGALLVIRDYGVSTGTKIAHIEIPNDGGDCQFADGQPAKGDE